MHNDRTAELSKRLRANFPEVPFETCETYADLPAALSHFQPDILYSVRFAGTDGFPRAAVLGKHAPAWICNGGVGTDHFGVWDADKVQITNAAGVASDMMAEYILGGFLHFTLNVPTLLANKAGRIWQPLVMRPLAGRTLLIVGLGHTGRALSRRAKAFGLSVIGTRANPKAMPDVDEVHPASDLGEVLPRADFIAICTPLTPATRGLIGAGEFAAMKQGVILADVSRGGVVDQTALLAALADGKVAAAVLDVFETEPLPAENLLWGAKNVLISPHCSSVYEGWEEASFTLFLDNFARWIAGKPLLNVVDPRRGY